MAKNRLVVAQNPDLLHRDYDDAFQVRRYLKNYHRKDYYFQLVVVLVAIGFLFILR